MLKLLETKPLTTENHLPPLLFHHFFLRIHHIRHSPSLTLLAPVAHLTFAPAASAGCVSRAAARRFPFYVDSVETGARCQSLLMDFWEALFWCFLLRCRIHKVSCWFKVKCEIAFLWVFVFQCLMFAGAQPLWRLGRLQLSVVPPLKTRSGDPDLLDAEALQEILSPSRRISTRGLLVSFEKGSDNGVVS